MSHSDVLMTRDEDTHEASPLDSGEPIAFSPSGRFDEEYEAVGTKKRSRVLHCFNCNRSESFFIWSKYRWYHPYLVGFTFGLVFLIGPYRCRCCGHSRMFIWNWMHPYRWLKK